MRILNAALVVSGGWRVLGYAQIVEQLSFMIKMIERVIIQMTPFISLFLLALLMFGFVFSSLDLKFGPDYTNMTNGRSGSLLPFAIWMLRTSLGDFDVETFQNMNRSLLAAVYIAWVLLVLLNMLIFLNLMIAVIGDVYSSVMETRTEESYQKTA